jgi:transcriptional enhancer factor
MKWRAVSFGTSSSELKQEWTKAEPLDDMDSELLDIATSQSQAAHPSNSLYHNQTSGLSQLAHHAYAVQPYHSQPQPPQLHIDTLTTWPSVPDLSTPSASAAPSTATDHSFASIPNLSHSQDTAPGFDANEFDFTGGRIDITGAFSPAIMAQYDAFSASHSADLSSLNALSGMDHQSLLDMGLSASDIATLGVGASQALSVSDPQLSQVPNCYSTKPIPSWNHGASLISSLESQAESYVSPWPSRPPHHPHHQPHHHSVAQHASLPISTSFSPNLIGHGDLHSSAANLNPSLWNLASPFHEDTSSGAAHMGSVGGLMGAPVGVMERKDSMQQSGLGNVGLGVLDLIERDQRTRGY